MKPIRKTIRFIAAFLIVNMLYYTFYPTIAYALTAGPTAPEATSFEPIDTTDMVNLLTGDLAYNIPLLEVPGPSGGYPLSLSYHAGIQPHEDASWVGLGWTLNPGAINRNVNGYADDHENVENTDRQFWEGETYQSYSLGVSYGIPGSPSSLSAGLTVSQHTHEGYGINYYGYGGGAVNLNGIGGKGIGSGFSVGNSQFKSNSLQTPSNYSFSRSLANQVYSTGISITTSRGSFTFNGRGVTGVNNSKSGKLSSEQHGFGIPLPLANSGYWLNLGYQYKRVWIDEIEDVFTNGVLHFPTSENYTDETDWFKAHAYDAYSIIDRDAPGGFVHNSNPNLGIGGTFPNYDDYNVNAQGLSGGMRPYLYQSHLAKQNEFKSSTEISKTYLTGLNPVGKVQFRFKNDFSNRYLYQEGDFDLDDSDASIKYDFGVPQTGDSFDDGIESNELAGSRHIKYFTNKEIIDEYTNDSWIVENDFIKTSSSGFVRSDLVGIDEQIGAFTITNESGVKYHFALPVYSFDEWYYSQNIKKDDDEGDSFNYLSKPEKYAYTWYLTAVTGPDFVDKGTIGILDKEDWGYWVEFDYGKWVDDFGWRNPVEGRHVDIDDEFENFSRGKKELYYLNSIKTKTHVAVFEKKLRADGKGVSFLNNTVVQANEEEGITYVEEGGFSLYKDAQGFYNKFPKSTLGLSNIYLLQRKDYEELGGDNIGEVGGFGKAVTHTINGVSKTIEVHHGANVIDESDRQPDLKAKAIRTISFEHDYSLVPETVNSFDEQGTLYTGHPTDDETESLISNKSGKLTLKKLFFLGNGEDGIEDPLIPPMEFDYDIPIEYQSVGVLREFNTTEGEYTIKQRPILGGDFDHGEPVKVVYPNGNIAHCTIRKNEEGTYIKYITGQHQSIGLSVYGVLITKTKNPAFEKDAYDIWGMYKSDVNYETLKNSEWEARKVSATSAKSIDAWSLRSIKTSLGSTIDIDYEPDRYQKPALYKDVNTVPIASIEQVMVSQIPNEPIKAIKFIFDDEIPESFSGLSGVIGVPYLHQIPAGYHDGLYFDNRYHETPTFKAVPFDINYANSTFYGKGVDENGKSYVTFLNLNLSNEIKEDMYIEEKYYVSRLPDWRIDKLSDNINLNVRYKYLGEAHLLYGNLEYKTNENSNYSGGGIRSKSINITENAKKSTTKYSYQPGVTSYEPSYINKISPPNYPDFTIKDHQDELTNYQDEEFYKNNRYYVNSETGAVNIDTQGQRAQVAALITQNNSSLFDDVLDHSTAIPPPGVLYPEVSVSESIAYQGTPSISIGGSIKYLFTTFTPSKVKLSKYSSYDDETTGDGFTQRHTAKVVLEDLTAHIGQLKEVITYDKKGKPINKMKNHFLTGGPNGTYETYKSNVENQFGGQGIIEETFSEARITQIEDSYYEYFNIDPGHLDYHLLGVLTQHEQVPLILQKQENINYKTGITTTTENLAFDFFSGAVTKTLSTDGYGNSYVTEVTPAYRIYDAGGANPSIPTTGGMGLAINGGKNMLTQEAQSITYKVYNETELNPVGVVSSNIQTWNDTWAYRTYSALPDPHYNQIANLTDDKELVWRKHKSYSYIGDGGNIELNSNGIYPYTEESFDHFNWWNLIHGQPISAQWQKTSQITLYDRYSHALEAIDINGNNAATKMDINQEHVYASVANASYNEFAYSGAEDAPNSNGYLGGEVLIPAESNATLEEHLPDLEGNKSPNVHTGTHSVRTEGADIAFEYRAEAKTNRNYLVSTWSNNEDISIQYSTNGTDFTTLSNPTVKPSNGSGWTRISGFIPVSANGDLIVRVVGNSAGTYHDDFRIHPIDASMTSYVYNEWGELSYVLDNNNLYTHYKYDAMGRLKSTHRETFQHGEVKISEHEIKYARSNE